MRFSLDVAPIVLTAPLPHSTLALRSSEGAVNPFGTVQVSLIAPRSASTVTRATARADAYSGCARASGATRGTPARSSRRTIPLGAPRPPRGGSVR